MDITHEHVTSDDPVTDEVLARLDDVEPPEDVEERRQLAEVDQAVRRHLAGEPEESEHAELARRLDEILRFLTAEPDTAETRRHAYDDLLAALHHACGPRRAQR
jgi:hypothetical protein